MAGRSKRTRRQRPAAFRRRTEPGAPPGTLVPDPNAPQAQIQVLAYGPDAYEERPLPDLKEVPALLERWPVTWINVEGVGDAATVEALGKVLHLHRLALEDVVHVHQRAKAEPYGDHYFLVARMPGPEQPWDTEQISFFLGQRFVLTFQEGAAGDCLDPVRTRIRAGWGRRSARPDYLVYALLDSIVDHYFPLVERCGERLDALEDAESVEPGRRLPNIMPELHGVKRDLVAIRRVIWPLRDAINALLRDTTPLIQDETRVYLRDVHDHTVQIIDLVESYRDISAGIADVFLAGVSQRTNETMKVLTIISTLFIPLTFIAGVYGMNFSYEASPLNMPELHWYWGYPAVWLVMLVTAAGLLWFFVRRGWLGGNNR